MNFLSPAWNLIVPKKDRWDLEIGDYSCYFSILHYCRCCDTMMDQESCSHLSCVHQESFSSAASFSLGSKNHHCLHRCLRQTEDWQSMKNSEIKGLLSRIHAESRESVWVTTIVDSKKADTELIRNNYCQGLYYITAMACPFLLNDLKY